jgi:hypothetical protein
MVAPPEAGFVALFRLAFIITEDPDAAAAVVADAVLGMRLGADAPGAAEHQLDLLRAVRLGAGLVSVPSARSQPGPRSAWADLATIAGSDVRDALALAVAGPCTTAEIARVMDLTRSQAGRHLTRGLRLLADLHMTP